MDAWQHVKLTCTNHSIGLIPQYRRYKPAQHKQTPQPNSYLTHTPSVMRWLGGYRERTKPDTIPNSDVKTFSAKGTAAQVVGEKVTAKPTHHRTQTQKKTHTKHKTQKQITHTKAGWSSTVARQAHNLKVAGSNPAPATNNLKKNMLASIAKPKRRAKPEPIKKSGH